MSERPKISIITPSKNSAEYIKETIESIQAQTYKNWEHIVVDAVSTDGTLDIFRQYPYLRWISEEDGDDDPSKKGLDMAKGEYVMFCAFSDGYVDKNWFKKCVEILDTQPEISLVWGIDQNMRQDGTLHKIVYNSWFKDPPPSGIDYVHYWLKTGQLFQERDFCVRKNVIDKCFPVSLPKTSGYWTFAYNFNTLGYLPYLNTSSVAAYGRIHSNSAAQRDALKGEETKWGKKYYRDIKEYRNKVLSGKIEHRYRDGDGNLLDAEFDVKKHFKSEEKSKFKKLMRYLVPPLFIWIKDKLLARYRVYKNVRKIRKDLSQIKKQ